MNSYKPQITIIGNGKPVVGIVAAMHGNESSPVIIDQLKQQITLQKGTVIFITANPYALSKKNRYIDTDLNRIFPGKAGGNIEEQLANELVRIGGQCDYLLDLHSCSMESQPFCIIRTPAGEQLELAKKTGLPNIVVYPKLTQKGGSFIDYVSCGIGLELGLHGKERTIRDGYHAVLRVLLSLQMIEHVYNENVKQKIYTVTGHLAHCNAFQPNNEIQNFQLIKKGDIIGRNKKHIRRAKYNFYPIMYRQKSYNKILCWVSKQLQETL